MIRTTLSLMLIMPVPAFPQEASILPKPLLTPLSLDEIEKARAAWATQLRVPERMKLDLGQKVILELALIPPGKFRGGSPKTEKDYLQKQFRIEAKGEEERAVTVSKPFYLAVTETTQEQYEAVLGSARNLSWFNPTGRGKNQVRESQWMKHPAERVTWNDAKHFCDELNERHGGKLKSRLPTEVEWEYACRAGTTSPFHFGSTLNGREANCLGAQLPYGVEQKGPYLERTTKVAAFAANAFGLYDMHGNVWEWCLDYYGEETRSLGETNPFRSAKVEKDLRVLRGGAWDVPAYRCRAAERAYAAPDRRDNAHGFRICIPIE